MLLFPDALCEYLSKWLHFRRRRLRDGDDGDDGDGGDDGDDGDDGDGVQQRTPRLTE